MSDEQVNNRKLEHINIINEDSSVDRRKFYFDDVQLVHRALPEIDLEEVDPHVEFMGKTLSFPLLISSMTGGDDELLKTINRNLAIAAEEMQVAMGVGSQRVMFTNPDSELSFKIRDYAPTTLLFSNLGAVQLNYDFTIDHCRKAVDCVKADGLYLHLNPLQEAIQPEGDCNFKGLSEKIKQISDTLEQPVILKEVGAGFSPQDLELAKSLGIRYIDVAGSGGTSWSRIEQQRHDSMNDDRGLGFVFQDWGIPTPLALKSLRKLDNEVKLIASGGIRSGIDMAKAVVLGAELCGLASPFLKPATESPEAVISLIQRLKKEFTTAMFLLGASRVSDIQNKQELILSS